ncbi:MAG TPA: hypothetical protein VM681_07305 [Candidatus Thermoplasmatota archaeon]|nr:hypothetical protein [Candidatus Thermoplasmatota archaeon]
MPRKAAAAPRAKAKAPAKKPAKAQAKATKASKEPKAANAAKTRGKSAAKARPEPADGPDESSRKERVVFPHDVYGPNKDDIKAPIKEMGLKWQFLGEGRGRWTGPGVTVFLQTTEHGQDMTVSGDAAKVQRVLDAWKPYRAATREAEKEVLGAEEDVARTIWRIDRPVQQPGEPASFYARRLAEWKAKEPGRAS